MTWTQNYTPLGDRLAASTLVAGVATGQHGEEGRILRSVFWHSLVLASLVGVLVAVQACYFPGVVPRQFTIYDLPLMI